MEWKILEDYIHHSLYGCRYTDAGSQLVISCYFWGNCNCFLFRNLVWTVYTTFNILFCHIFQCTVESFLMRKDNTSEPHPHLGIRTACIRAGLF